MPDRAPDHVERRVASRPSVGRPSGSYPQPEEHAATPSPAKGSARRPRCERPAWGSVLADGVVARGPRRRSGAGARRARGPLPWPRPGVEAPAALPPLLSPEQEQAVAGLVGALDEPGRSSRLLGRHRQRQDRGLPAPHRARARRGEGAILLVPEIALTPQTIRRGEGPLRQPGGRVPQRASSRGNGCANTGGWPPGKARIVVGARSAVFAPVDDLGLIIIDEAHDNSYKQEEEPRYRVKTVAELRLARNGGLLLEGSATPRSRAWPRRGGAGAAVPPGRRDAPEMEVVDMRRQGARAAAGPAFARSAGRSAAQGRAGHHPAQPPGLRRLRVLRPCGHVLMCADCELSLTYPSGARPPLPSLWPGLLPAGRLPQMRRSAAHAGFAGHRAPRPGTAHLVPGEQVFRMDSDVSAAAPGPRPSCRASRTPRPGVLVGTQMVAKGHDFPDVTLVIVADADVGLYVPDFRAANGPSSS